MLKIQGLTKHYKGSNKGVTNLSLNVKAGDIFAFIGHNGAGKTTTLKCVVGIHDFEEGEIYINGISMKENPLACKKTFAYIPDSPNLYDYLTGIQYLNFIADVFEVSAEERQERIQKYAEEFGILQSLGDLISSYSHLIDGVNRDQYVKQRALAKIGLVFTVIAVVTSLIDIISGAAAIDTIYGEVASVTVMYWYLQLAQKNYA